MVLLHERPADEVVGRAALDNLGQHGELIQLQLEVFDKGCCHFVVLLGRQRVNNLLLDFGFEVDQHFDCCQVLVITLDQLKDQFLHVKLVVHVELDDEVGRLARLVGVKLPLSQTRQILLVDDTIQLEILNEVKHNLSSQEGQLLDSKFFVVLGEFQFLISGEQAQMIRGDPNNY